MFKIITFTDIHLADKNPSSRIDNYMESILNKLEQARDICINRKVDVALCGGDIFHIKTPTKNSHFLVSRTIDILKSFPCPVYSIYGNHDLRQDNITTLPKQPFYTLVKSGGLTYLSDEMFDKGNIRIFGMDYCSFPTEEDFNKENKGEKIQICVAHVNASSQFSDLFGEKVYRYQDLQHTSPNIFVFGHYHPDQGIEIHNNKHFINVGSLSRGSLKKDELSRIPNLGYVEIDDNYEIKCEKIPLKVLPAKDIFDLEMKGKEEKEQEEIEKFITEMKDNLSLTKSDDIGDKIKSLNFERSIIEKAMFYYSERGD
jgi:DNA repair exonuclease SbcCD nuclease subunit